MNYWLDWCQAEFGLTCLGSDLRGLQGAELCALDRDAFLNLISDCTAGEILWEHLEDMRRGEKINTDPASFCIFIYDLQSPAIVTTTLHNMNINWGIKSIPWSDKTGSSGQSGNCSFWLHFQLQTSKLPLCFNFILKNYLLSSCGVKLI